MLIYFILLFIVTGAAYLARKAGDRGATRFLISVAFASMVLVAGLRSGDVGTDSNAYIARFEQTTSFSDIWRGNTESAYFLLNWFIRQFTDQYAFLFLAIGAIVVGCFMRSMLQHSSEWEIAFFAFLVCGVYTFSFNAVRQGIACAIYSFALGPLINRKLGRYVCIVLIASLFHQSALVALPAYFLIRPSSGVKYCVLIVLLGILLGVFFSFVAETGTKILEDRDSVQATRYANALQSEDVGGGVLIAAFDVVVCIFFFLFRRHVTKDPELYGLCLAMYLLGTVIEVICAIQGLDPNNVSRLSFYFSYSIIFLWPIVFRNIRDFQSRLEFSMPFFACYLVFYALSLQRFSWLVPYKLNLTLFQ